MMRVLSLFDGISCGQIALERAGIPVDIYYASEIDKYAMQITQKNYPNTIQLGDVRKINFSQFEGKIDLLIGGSPCQDLSIAGKRAGLSGERSGLFYKFIEALNTIKPKYFLLENNVGMPKDAYEEISRLLGCFPVEINSSLVSAQNRRRFYWTNIGDKNYNLFGFPTCSIRQPENKHIYLKDVLNMKTNRTLEDNIICIKMQKQVKVRKHRVNIDELKRTLNEHKLKMRITNKSIADKLNKPITNVEHWFRKDNCFSIPDTDVWFDLKKILNIETNVFDKQITEFEIRNSKYEMSNRVYHIAGKSPTLTTNSGGHQNKVIIDDDNNLFFLTPEDCEKLQTLPVGYTAGISNRQRFKCIGNCWTVNVIAHIFGGLNND